MWIQSENNSGTSEYLRYFSSSSQATYKIEHMLKEKQTSFYGKEVKFPQICYSCTSQKYLNVLCYLISLWQWQWQSVRESHSNHTQPYEKPPENAQYTETETVNPSPTISIARCHRIELCLILLQPSRGSTVKISIKICLWGIIFNDTAGQRI